MRIDVTSIEFVVDEIEQSLKNRDGPSFDRQL
jgi:hypothetical protein